MFYVLFCLIINKLIVSYEIYLFLIVAIKLITFLCCCSKLFNLMFNVIDYDILIAKFVIYILYRMRTRIKHKFYLYLYTIVFIIKKNI